MEYDYKQFQMGVIALAPIHIGSGEKYTNREFIYENGSYYFPDMGKFYEEMIRRRLDAKFERFLLTPSTFKNPIRLTNFINDNRITERNFGGYTLAASGFETNKPKQGSIAEISKFMRDGLGQPYIPGSSLKGAIRTILMNTNWSDTNFIHKINTRKGTRYSEDRKAIQALADIFHDIRVSDSQPLHNEDLTIVQKWDYSITPRNAKITGLPLYRESLKPLTKLNFTITASRDAYKLLSRLSEFAKDFYADYKAFFLDEKSKKDYIQDNVQCSPIYLGAGSGVWTKTVMLQADGIVQKRYAKRKKMVGKGAVKLTKFPQEFYNKSKKLIKNNENFYEMGKACFMIKEVK